MNAMKLWSLCAALLLAMTVLPLSSVARDAVESSNQGKAPPPAINQTAQRVMRDLSAQGYEVAQGYPMLWTEQHCDRYTSPILHFCGNDPDSPYVILAVKSWPDEFVDPAMVNAFGKTRQGFSATYRLDPREAIIVLGQLPRTRWCRRPRGCSLTTSSAPFPRIHRGS
jgi:hypothetical protein